jgi:hypothetical protein
MSPTRLLEPGCFVLLAWLLVAPLAAQETGRDAAPASLRVSPSFWFDGQYSRVEGLPVRLGPVLERGGPSPFRLGALVIWRAGVHEPTDPEAFGYRIEARQRWGTSRALVLGATAHSVVTPIEERQVGDLGASLSAFFLHRDLRDHLEREGFSGFASLTFPEPGVTIRATYTDEEHAFLPVGDPPAVSGETSSWRPQPLVAVGRVRAVTGEVVVGDGPRASSPGRALGPDRTWGLSARVTTAVGGALTLPAYMDAEPGPTDTVAAERAVAADFVTGFVDARRYIRLGRVVTVRLRALAAGSLDGDALPPQHQHALGGVGSLPGYRTFSADCGARSRTYSVFHGDGAGAMREPAFAAYGCDAVGLFQVELGGRLPFVGGPDSYTRPDGEVELWDPFLDLRPRWSVFFDAGKGWSMSAPGGGAPEGSDTEVLMDMGVGLLVESVGLYWAWPLGGSGGRRLFFLRLTHRF